MKGMIMVNGGMGLKRGMMGKLLTNMKVMIGMVMVLKGDMVLVMVVGMIMVKGGMKQIIITMNGEMMGGLRMTSGRRLYS